MLGIDSQATALQPQIDESWLEALADKVIERRLEVALDFFLESHLPVTTFLLNVGFIAQPLVTPFFGAERVQRWQALLSDREQLEKFLCILREKSHAKAAA